MNRRSVLKMLAGGAGLLSGLMPLTALANKLMGKRDPIDAIKAITGGSQSASDKLILKTPKLAENGAQVPITVDATALDGVKSISLVVHENPKPVALKINFDSSDVVTFASFRVKMGKPTKVTAIAQTASGFVTASGSTKVTKGGC